MQRYFLIVLVGTSFLAGCQTGPIPERQASDVPTEWEQEVAPDAPIWPERGWWIGFGSSELNRIISAVEDENLSLAAAEQRVLQADTRIRLAGAPLLPRLSGGFSGSRSGDLGTAASFGDSFDLSVSTSYEIDFWGRNRAGLTAALAAGKASRADRETVALTAVAGAANTYFQLLSLRQRLETAHLNLDIAQSVLDVTDARVRNGIGTPLELAQQLGTIAAQQALIPQLEQQELEARAALALLIGRPPEDFDVDGRNLDDIFTPEVAPGLPSELLIRRPDVVAAEADLIAAHADLITARAALFPSVALTASGGLSSDTLAGLADSVISLGLGTSLSQVIFDAGARAAQNQAAAQRELEVLANYRSTIISAFAEVETALGNIGHLAEQERYEIVQDVQAQFAFDIVEARYREGVADYLTLLDAQRTLYQSRDALGQIKLARLQAVVSLFQALGGGWSDPSAGIAVAEN